MWACYAASVAVSFPSAFCFSFSYFNATLSAAANTPSLAICGVDTTVLELYVHGTTIKL